MATLTGSTIAATYDLLLKIDNTGIATDGTLRKVAGIATDGTLRKVEDGDATDSALSLSDVSIAVDATDKIFLDAGSDTYIFESGADVLDFYVGGANMLKLTESTLDTIAMIGNATLTHTVTTSASTPIGLLIDDNTSGVAAQNSVGLHVDFDRTVAGSGTAAHNDIGINLDVNSASLGTSSLVGMDIDVVGASSGTSTATGVNIAVGSADTNYALITSGGNVGIGTAAPSEKLTVSYGIGTETTLTGVLSLEGTDTLGANMGEGSGPSLDFRLPTSTTTTHVSARIGCPREGGDEDANAGTLSFYTASTKDATATVKMTILKGGDVGIGTTAPVSKVHINHASDSAIRGTLSGSGVTATDGWLAGYVGGEDYFKLINYEPATDMRFYTTPSGGSATHAMTIYRDGNVGIGTSAPAVNLHLDSASTTELRIDGEAHELLTFLKSGTQVGLVGYSNSDSTLKLSAGNGAIAANANGISINSSGNVGIGDTNPDEAKLSITGVASGDYGIKIDQDQNTAALYIDQNSTAGGAAIEIDSEAATGISIFVDGPLTTTVPVLKIADANALTTGNIAMFESNASNTSTRDLVQIINNNPLATGATCLFIDQDANQIALKIDSEADTGQVLLIDDPVITTGNILSIQDCDALTTGRAINVYSNSSSNSARNLVHIVNDHAATDNAVGLYIQQDGNGSAISIAGVGNGGIKFGGGASSDVNTLDDYEEGTWTVTAVGSSSGNFVLGTSEREGVYTKIGRTVHIQGAVQIDSDSSTSGDVRISLPFTNANLGQIGGRVYGTAYLINAGSTLAGKIILHVPEGAAYFTLAHISDDGATYQSLTHAELDTSWFLGFAATFTV